MNKKSFFNTVLAFILCVSILGLSLPPVGYAQMAPKTSAAKVTDLEKRLSLIETKLEKRRQELGIPGVSLAIVKDGQVLLSKGFGYKDFEKKVPMTADTQLAIGSASKAFTALSVLMLQDEDKLSLDDSPKKYLPYFKINHPETDKNIQVRDLLAHSSGINRTDLAMITGKLNRVELIKVAGEAKPMAGLREKFFYQNIMFTAAGEIVAEITGRPWEKFVPERIFKPLGMNNSTMSVKEMQKAKDYSFGYSYNFDTKETRKLPTRDIGEVAPAGSINSSANDMARWLRFVLNEGELDGKRLVSEKGFDEWTKPQMKISPDGKASYGLGWFLQDWKGKKVVQHGGNIDGFNSMVAMIPEENLGFVMLTNVSASSLGGELMQIVWSAILEDISETPVSDAAKKEIGKYKFAQAGFDIEVKIEEGKLVAVVPGQPTYILENVEGRKYKLSNAPDGFFITFKDGEAYFEQPQGNFTLPKIGAEKKDETNGHDSAKELIGRYESEQEKGNIIEIKEVEGKTSLVVGVQPPYPLVKKAENEFISPNLPEGFSVKIKRGGDKKIEGLTLVQPNGEFAFKYLGETEKNEKPEISAEELLAKTIDALGGGENMRKLNSRQMKFELDFVHQGLKAKGVTYQKAPNKSASVLTIDAFGKRIAEINDYFDGEKGGETYSFGPDEVYTGQRLEDIKFGNDFHGLLDWKDKLKKASIVKTDKIGEEEVYVVLLEPEKASPVTMFISTKSFLPLREISIVVSSTSSQKIPITENFEDYREVDGVMIPFKVTSNNPGMGEIVTYVKEVTHNTDISDKKFQK
jgi:CubicO group peptidase (beta-lactamase class C family)